MVLLKLTEKEADMLFDALRNHLDYVDGAEEENTLDALFDKLHDAEIVAE